MNIEKVEQILNTIKFLLKEEADLLLYKLNSNKGELIKSILFNNEVNCCINCGSINFHKHVKRNNKQRYKCYDCKKTFNSTSNTIFSGFHKSHINKFKKFIEYAINNLLLKRTAEICKISVSCAFHWRHKLIASLTNKQKYNEITGLIEIDEIYFRNSNKGNFKSGIGRKARTHSYCPNLEDNVGLSKSKIYIPTGIDRTKNVLIDFVGFGKPNANSLYKCYQSKIKALHNSKIITDGDRVYIDFSKQIGCENKMLSKHNSNSHKVRKLPIIEKDGNIKYHIQNVNNFHSQITDIINSKFKGVSTKYILQYINWVKWLRLNKNNFYLMVDNLIKQLSNNKL